MASRPSSRPAKAPRPLTREGWLAHNRDAGSAPRPPKPAVVRSPVLVPTHDAVLARSLAVAFYTNDARLAVMPACVRRVPIDAERVS